MPNGENNQQTRSSSGYRPALDAKRGYGGRPPANVQKPEKLPPPPPSSKQTKDNK